MFIHDIFDFTNGIYNSLESDSKLPRRFKRKRKNFTKFSNRLERILELFAAISERLPVRRTIGKRSRQRGPTSRDCSTAVSESYSPILVHRRMCDTDKGGIHNKSFEFKAIRSQVRAVSWTRSTLIWSL